MLASHAWQPNLPASRPRVHRWQVTLHKYALGRLILSWWFNLALSLKYQAAHLANATKHPLSSGTETFELRRKGLMVAKTPASSLEVAQRERIRCDRCDRWHLAYASLRKGGKGGDKTPLCGRCYWSAMDGIWQPDQPWVIVKDGVQKRDNKSKRSGS